MNRIFAAISMIFVITSINAQIEGAQLFEEPQVVTIELEFSQTGWWDSLTANYETASWMKGDVTITDATGTYYFPEVGVRLKGNSSYSIPGDKKSFKIDFNEYVSGQNYDGLKKLNFSNGFKEPSFMREKILSELCQELGLPSPRANYANVYMNGTLWGFYTVIEQIDDQFLDWKMENDDGNMFKAGDNFMGSGGEADLLDYGSDQSAYYDRYEIENNEDINDWTDLVDFISFINNSSDADFEVQLDDWLETDQFLMSMAMDNLFSNLDAYNNSARNYYLYHHTGTDKWNWIKWDMNEAFGTYNGGGMGGGGLSMTDLDIYYSNSNRPLLERVMEIDGLRSRYDEQLCTVYNAVFSSEKIQDYIDIYYPLIKDYVYADSNKMYSNDNFDDNLNNDIVIGGGMGGSTFYGLTSFVDAKSSYVEGEIDCSVVNGLSSETQSPLELYPNPAHQLVFVGGSSEAVVHIFTLDGNILVTAQPGWVNVTALPAGMYIVQVQDDTTRYQSALVKE